MAGPVLSLLLLVALSIGFACLSCEAYAEQVGSSDVDFSLSVDATPSLEIVLAGDGLTTSPTSLGLNIKPNIDGTPVFGYSDLDVTVATSNATGYYLNFSTTNADGSLRTTSSSTLSTLADTGTFTCTTATASTCSFTTNRWGYKLAQDDATSYVAAPGSDGTKIDEIYTKTNGVTSNLRVGAKVDSSLTAGNYSTTMSFAATAHPTTYGIYYNYGAAEGTSPAPSGLPGNQSGALNNASTTTVTLSSSTPTWTGHTFNKWCLGTVTSTEYADDTCSGTEYSAGDSIVFDINGDVSVTLKAMWNINTYTATIKTATGISKVTLNGTECASTSGCNVSNLIYGKGYSLVATLDTGYSLSTWSATAGTIADNTASTTYTVGAGNATITPGATLNQYNVTVTFNTGANQVSFTNATYGTVTATASSPTVSLYYNQPYTATMSFSDNYEFGSWASGTNTSVSNTSLNPTTITLTGTGNGTITANGKSSKIYMQTMSFSQCTSAGVTVYDSRNESVSYTVKLISLNGKNTCWMMSNLKLPGGTVLTTSDSNVSSSYTLPSQTEWTSSSQDDYCKPRMAYVSSNDEYYYNWPAATARTNSTSDIYSGCSNDTDNSVGDICPKGWRLPVDSGEVDNSTWLSNLQANGSLTTTGIFFSGSQYDVGSWGYWWTSIRNDDGSAGRLNFNGSTASANYNGKRYGLSVRCILDKTLYHAVAKQSKGTQTAAQLQEKISASNSGVYTYNSSVFGAASDAANTSTIYYYRGILDNTTGSYGSNGDGAAYPNYVKLDNNTCWRILRTTGSGGVKMIYNGTWTGSTCANSTTNAQLSSASVYNTNAASNGKSIVAVGYTYNSSYAKTTGSTAASSLFGTNSSYSGNTSTSNIKTAIDNWYNSNMTSYTSHLEPSAGYCADRSIYADNSYASALAESTSISTPYTTADTGITIYRFGAFARTRSSSQNPSLGCPRSTVDLYTTNSASNGNKQLSNPVALITADEASFAGSGSSTASEGSSYNKNSFLRSGSLFWLLSPYIRSYYGYTSVFILYSDGYLLGNDVNNTNVGVRPAISLASGTMISGGSGTATDPWTVTW